MEDDDLYDYEYSDDTEDELMENKQVVHNENDKPECEPKLNHKKEPQLNELMKKEQIAYDEDTGSHKDAEEDDSSQNEDDLLMDSVVINGQIVCDNKVYISPSTEPHDESIDDEALYQYDDEDSESQNDLIGSPIFSRVHSPPPRHRNNLKDADRLFLSDE